MDVDTDFTISTTSGDFTEDSVLKASTCQYYALLQDHDGTSSEAIHMHLLGNQIGLIFDCPAPQRGTLDTESLVQDGPQIN